MAEVAVSISNSAVWQIAAEGKGPLPKILPVPNGGFWGRIEDVRNCHPKKRMEC